MGARLLLFESQWVQITQNPWVLEIIRHGYTLEFQNSTPMFQGIKRTILSNAKQKEILRREFLTLLEKEAIVEVPKRSQNQGFYSTLFMVPKKNSEKLRPVINLKPFNQFLVKKTFKMDHLKVIIKVMQQGDWTVSIDLTDAYMHIPIRQSHQRFLRFAVDNQVWQFRALPFGPTTAPRIFTKLVSVVVQYLRQQGVQIWTYLDDWILTHQNPNQLLAHRDIVLNTLVRLGFLPNLIKSDLVPSQDVNFIGAWFLLNPSSGPSSDFERDSRANFKSNFFDSIPHSETFGPNGSMPPSDTLGKIADETNSVISLSSLETKPEGNLGINS